jgi:hypothetical protein
MDVTHDVVLFYPCLPEHDRFPSGKHHIPFLSFVFLTGVANAVKAVKDIEVTFHLFPPSGLQIMYF